MAPEGVQLGVSLVFPKNPPGPGELPADLQRFPRQFSQLTHRFMSFSGQATSLEAGGAAQVALVLAAANAVRRIRTPSHSSFSSLFLMNLPPGSVPSGLGGARRLPPRTGPAPFSALRTSLPFSLRIFSSISPQICPPCAGGLAVPVPDIFSASFASAQPSTVAAAIRLLVTLDRAGYSPLHHAAASGDLPLLQAILAVLVHVRAPFPTVDVRDKLGATPLAWAVQRGHSALIKALLDAGASPSAQDNEGRSILGYAVGAASRARSDAERAFCHDMTRFLLQCGADTSAQDQDGATCIHLAAATGDDELVGILVELGGAPVNVRDHEGETALFYAVREGHPALAAKLIHYGADATAVADSQETVLDFARALGDTKAIQHLEAVLHHAAGSNVDQHPADSGKPETSVSGLFGSVDSVAMWSSNPAHLLR